MFVYRKFAATVVAGVLAVSLAACSDDPAPQSTPSAAASASASSTPAKDAQGFALLPAKVWNFGDVSNNQLATDFPHETGGDGWGNHEVQYYTDGPSNAFIQNDHLVIKAAKVGKKELAAKLYDGRKYTSARLTTKGTFEFTYGKVIWKDVVLPKGDGTWSALWAWPAGKKYTLADVTPSPNGNIGSLNGEIDVMENVGVEAAEINCSAHAYTHHPKGGERSGQVTLADNAIYQPHTYRLDWTPDYLQFWVDDTMYRRIEKIADPGVAGWPYDQPYFLILNVAMGGDWGGMYRNQYGLDADGIDPHFKEAAMSIGGIEYYPYVG